MSDKAIYQQAFEEMNSDNRDQALWAMVWTKAGGDENRAKAQYVEARVNEIAARQVQERKWRMPRPEWHIGSLVALVVGAIAFAVIKDLLATSYDPYAPRLRGDFWLVGILSYSLGLLAFPALMLLISWGRWWGHCLAYIVLLSIGCLSGQESAPPSVNSAGYYGGAFGFLGVCWLIYVVIALNRAPRDS